MGLISPPKQHGFKSEGGGILGKHFENEIIMKLVFNLLCADAVVMYI